jgi:hypothetical protein
MTTHARRRLVTASLLLAVLAAPAGGAVAGHHDAARRADAVCQGTVLARHSFRDARDHGLYTALKVRVDRTLKGALPRELRIVQRGGRLHGRGEIDFAEPRLPLGQPLLLCLARRGDGTWRILGSPQPASGTVAQTQEHTLPAAGAQKDGGGAVRADGLLSGFTGYSFRFTACDRGEPIPYVVDMDAWPPALTANQVLTAVSNAVNAWTAVSSARFHFDGIASFGAAPANLTNTDERLYIQVHDLHGYINSANTLALGGAVYTYNTNLPPDVGLGGGVGTNAFDLSLRGHVVMEHTNSQLAVASTFEEALCHEIGHVLGLAHSSENPDETDATLADALMYYRIHADGRGADPSDWDAQELQAVYPCDNTPPFGVRRVLHALTAWPGSPPAPARGINRIRLAGYDLQTDPLSFSAIRATTGNGVFTVQGDLLSFFPVQYDADYVLPVHDNSSWDYCLLRVSDGVNRSPPFYVYVKSFLVDEAPADGLADSWADANSVVGGPDDDDDDDGFTNLEEWMTGTHPRDPDSRLAVTNIAGRTLQWPSRAGEIYEVYSATGLAAAAAAWTLAGGPVSATGTQAAAETDVPVPARRFYRVGAVW